MMTVLQGLHGITLMSTWILLIGKIPSMIRLGSASRICKMSTTETNLMTSQLLPVSEVGEKNDSLMGKKRKIEPYYKQTQKAQFDLSTPNTYQETEKVDSPQRMTRRSLWSNPRKPDAPFD